MRAAAAAMSPTDPIALVREATDLLERAGCDTPQLDAELIVAHALGTDRAGLRRLAGDALPAGVEADARRMIGLRVERRPVAQITGRRWFRNLELAVDGSVLSPRPETELLVEWALALPRGARVADIGTGSGAIALALADERPDLELIATDISPEALRVAIANAGRLGLDVAFAAGDMLDAVDGPLDAVVSNPPYIPEQEVEGLAPEVSRWEPMVALTPGPTGFEAIERLAAQAAARRVGRIAIEVGSGQAAAVRAILAERGWERVTTLDDLAGIERVVTGERLEGESR